MCAAWLAALGTRYMSMDEPPRGLFDLPDDFIRQVLLRLDIRSFAAVAGACHHTKDVLCAPLWGCKAREAWTVWQPNKWAELFSADSTDVRWRRAVATRMQVSRRKDSIRSTQYTCHLIMCRVVSQIGIQVKACDRLLSSMIGSQRHPCSRALKSVQWTAMQLSAPLLAPHCDERNQ